MALWRSGRLVRKLPLSSRKQLISASGVNHFIPILAIVHPVDGAGSEVHGHDKRTLVNQSWQCEAINSAFGELYLFRRLYAYDLVHFNNAGNLFPRLPIHTSPVVMGFDAAVLHAAVRKREVEFSSNRPYPG